MLQFAHPHLLWLLLTLPFLAWLKGKRGRSVAIRYPSADIARQVGGAPRSQSGRLLSTLFLLALGLLIITLARPQLGRGFTEAEASGVDIMLAIDVSSSMEALDFKLDGKRSNRLEVVKKTVARFIEARPNDRIGLVAFAGRPYLVSPLTLDHDWLLSRLEAVKIGQVEDGTAIGSAIASSAGHLSDADAKSRLMILLTDGMNNTGQASPLTSAEAAKTLGIKIYTIGAGTRGEAPIPVEDRFGRRVLRMAKVDLDEEMLTEIAEMSGASYFRATDSESLAEVYGQIDTLEKTDRKLKKFQETDELFSHTALTGLGFLLLGFGLKNTTLRELP